MPTTKSDTQYNYTEKYGYLNETTLEQENILNSDKVFFLSSEEMGNKTYGFESYRSDYYQNNRNRVGYYNGEAKTYWLRSAYYGNSGLVMNIDEEGWRSASGILSNYYKTFWATTHAARPAFNIASDSILLTSMVGSGKSANGTETGLTAVAKKGNQGEKGETGSQGEKGEKGDRGEAGLNGLNGLTPFIGDNGNWWVGETDTGVKATAEVPVSDTSTIPAIATIGTVAGISLLSNLGLLAFIVKHKKLFISKH